MNVIFMGTPEFALPSLRAVHRNHNILAVVTQPDRPKGRKHVTQPPPVKVEAEKLGLPVLQPESLRLPEFCAWLTRTRPDVNVVVAFGRILPAEILSAPRFGSINVHASLLPKYRGAAPIARAIMNGEQVTGVTTMWMQEELDSGDIILQQEVPIPPQMNCGELTRLLADLGAELLLKTLDLVSKQCAPAIPQDHSQATYAPPIRKEEEKINWNRPAQEVINQIRALSPSPGAYTILPPGKTRLKIFSAERIDRTEPGIPPGRVAYADAKTGFGVKAQDAVIHIASVQPEGKKIMAAAEFVRGYRLAPGTILGIEQGSPRQMGAPT